MARGTLVCGPNVLVVRGRRSLHPAATAVGNREDWVIERPALALVNGRDDVHGVGAVGEVDDDRLAITADLRIAKTFPETRPKSRQDGARRLLVVAPHDLLALHDDEEVDVAHGPDR